MEINHDFRYEHTLRLNFDIPVGMSSYGFETKTKLEEFYNDVVDNDYTFELMEKCDSLGDEINEIIKTSLAPYKIDDDMLLDWRDELELEVHGINQEEFDENVIEEIKKRLKELLEL